MSKWLAFLLLVAALASGLPADDPPLDFTRRANTSGDSWRGRIISNTRRPSRNGGGRSPGRPRTPGFAGAANPARAGGGGLLAGGGEQLWIPADLGAVLAAGRSFLAAHRGGDGVAARGVDRAGVYLFMPFAIMASRSFQPDPMMVMMMLVSLRLLLRYDSEPMTNRFVAVTAAALVALLVRHCARSSYLQHLGVDGRAAGIVSRGAVLALGRVRVHHLDAVVTYYLTGL